MPASLQARVRPPRREPVGAVVLLHGRGADENDLFPLLDLLDPPGSRIGVTLRGPLVLPPGGAHWYALGGIPTPDPDTFWSTFERVGAWFDEFFDTSGIAPKDTVIGGFSQGCVMSYALTFAEGRPSTGGLLAFSGFMPEVGGLTLAPEQRSGLKVAIGHGTQDGVIPVTWSRRARETLGEAGADILYRESPMPHSIDPDFVREAAAHVLGEEPVSA